MSAELTAWAWAAPIKSHSQKLVLLALADSQGIYGRVSISILSSKTGLSPKTTRTALAALERAGVVTKAQQAIADAGYSISGSVN